MGVLSKKEKDCSGYWTDFKELSCHNLLSLSSISDTEYFEAVLSLPQCHSLVFERLPFHRNILHVLFTGDHVDKFKQLLHIVSHHFPDRVGDLVAMLDETDESLLTPLDVLIKHKLYDHVEVYTKLINSK